MTEQLTAKMLEAINKWLTSESDTDVIAKSCAEIALQFGRECFSAGQEKKHGGYDLTPKYKSFEDYINKKP